MFLKLFFSYLQIENKVAIHTNYLACTLSKYIFTPSFCLALLGHLGHKVPCNGSLGGKLYCCCYFWSLSSRSSNLCCQLHFFTPFLFSSWSCCPSWFCQVFYNFIIIVLFMFLLCVLLITISLSFLLNSNKKNFCSQCWAF